ncbi:MAG: hypothetical protein RBS07_17795, partial [Lentimicrobium sp.]|nr:hypothetical protein [Lentimicrobium sp.]
MKKSRPIMFIIFSVFFSVLLLAIGVFIFLSPGKPRPFVNKEGRVLAGSISEKIFVTINGAKQGMFIQSIDSTKPVLLYLHGGIP